MNGLENKSRPSPVSLPLPPSLDENCILMCVHIRMNGTVASFLLVCLFFLPRLLPFSSLNSILFPDARPTGISSRNIFGWQPLMSARHPKKIRLVGDSSVVQLYIYFSILLSQPSARLFSLALFLHLFFSFFFFIPPFSLYPPLSPRLLLPFPLLACT